MANAGTSAVRIIDSDNEVASVTSNRLDVNATLVAGATIDIGDVDMFLDGGTAILGGAGDVAAGVLRVTVADNDPHFGAVGSAADNDGNIHGQLYFANNKMQTIDEDTGTIKSNTNSLIAVLVTLGLSTYTEGSSVGTLFGAVRNDTLAALAGTDNEFAPFQVNDIGALYVTGESKQQTAVTDYGFSIMGEAKVIDGSTLPNTVSEGNSGRLAMSRAGVAYTCLTDDVGASDLGATIATHLSEIEGAVETIEGAVSGSEMQVDIVSSATLSVNSHAVTNAGTFAVQSTLQAGSAAIGKLAANSGVDIGDVDVTSISAGTNAIGKVGHDITGGADGVTTVSSAGTDVVLGGDVGCKKIDIQAQTDNTGIIAVGFTGVDATVATGTGVILNPGDIYSLEVNNLNLIYIDSTVSGEGVRYTYFT